MKRERERKKESVLRVSYLFVSHRSCIRRVLHTKRTNEKYHARNEFNLLTKFSHKKKKSHTVTNVPSLKTDCVGARGISAHVIKSNTWIKKKKKDLFGYAFWGNYLSKRKTPGTNNYCLIVSTYFHFSGLILMADSVSADASRALENQRALLLAWDVDDRRAALVFQNGFLSFHWWKSSP